MNCDTLVDIELMIHESYYNGKINGHEYENLLSLYTIKETAMVIKYSSDVYLEKSARTDNIDSVKNLDKIVMEPIYDAIEWCKRCGMCDSSSKPTHVVDLRANKVGAAKLARSFKKSHKICSTYLKWLGDWKSTIYTVPKNVINEDTTTKYDQIISKHKSTINMYVENINDLEEKINEVNKKVGKWTRIYDYESDDAYNAIIYKLGSITTFIKKDAMAIQRELNKVSMSAVKNVDKGKTVTQKEKDKVSDKRRTVGTARALHKYA